MRRRTRSLRAPQSTRLHQSGRSDRRCRQSPNRPLANRRYRVRSIDLVMTDVWRRMLPGDRRALAVMGYCHNLERKLLKGDFVPWTELETADRIALIRSMRTVGDLAEMCAGVLEQARDAVEVDAYS